MRLLWEEEEDDDGCGPSDVEAPLCDDALECWKRYNNDRNVHNMLSYFHERKENGKKNRALDKNRSEDMRSTTQLHSLLGYSRFHGQIDGVGKLKMSIECLVEVASKSYDFEIVEPNKSTLNHMANAMFSLLH